MMQAAMYTEAKETIDHVGFFAVERRNREVALFYDPPYENEVDDRLARHLVAYLTPAASLEYKANVWAAYSACSFDFMIDLGTRRIAIDYSATPDDLAGALVEDNDALALGAGIIDIVFRIRGRDLEERMYDCLHLIAQWEPNLFTPYGRRIFASRASVEARRISVGGADDVLSVAYPEPAPEEVVAFGDVIEWPLFLAEHQQTVMRRLSRERPDYWRRQYERASLVYGTKITAYEQA
jgi:hypothetical protein